MTYKEFHYFLIFGTLLAMTPRRPTKKSRILRKKASRKPPQDQPAKASTGRRHRKSIETVDTSADSEVEMLKHRVSEIRAEWSRRLDAPKGPVARTKKDTGKAAAVAPYDYATTYLKQAIYELVLSLPNDRERNLKLIEAVGGTHPRGAVSGHRVFLRLINLIAASDLTRPEHYRYADELTYARRHFIPPVLLAGFIFQVGPRLSASVKDNLRETWFDKDKHTLGVFKS